MSLGREEFDRELFCFTQNYSIAESYDIYRVWYVSTGLVRRAFRLYSAPLHNFERPKFCLSLVLNATAPIAIRHSDERRPATPVRFALAEEGGVPLDARKAGRGMVRMSHTLFFVFVLLPPPSTTPSKPRAANFRPASTKSSAKSAASPN